MTDIYAPVLINLASWGGQGWGVDDQPEERFVDLGLACDLAIEGFVTVEADPEDDSGKVPIVRLTEQGWSRVRTEGFDPPTTSL